MRQQGVIARVGRQDHSAGLIGVAQCCVAWFGKVEVHQPVVDQINRLTIQHRPDLTGDQHLLGQFNFRAQILILRRVIDNRDPAQRRRTTLPLPFGPEHRDHRSLEPGNKAVTCEMHPSDTAQGLRLCQQGIQKRAARIGVHLDQFWSVVGQMKIIAHQGSFWPMIGVRNRGCPAQNSGHVCRDLCHLLDGHHDLLHGIQGICRQKHRDVRKQMRLIGRDPVLKPRIARRSVQRPTQFDAVQRDAETGLVEVFGCKLGPAKGLRLNGVGHLNLLRPGHQA